MYNQLKNSFNFTANKTTEHGLKNVVIVFFVLRIYIIKDKIKLFYKITENNFSFTVAVQPA